MIVRRNLLSPTCLVLVTALALGRDAEPRDLAPPASTSAASQPATSPARTPREEAELAIKLADEGHAADALALAKSSHQREPRLDVALLAMGVALDASNRGLQAITYFKQYIDTPFGHDRDWRGHARLANVYLRNKTFQLAAQEIEKAEKAPLFPATDPVTQVYLLADKTEANINLAERRSFALSAVEEIARFVQNSETVRKQPRLILACAKAAFSVEGYRKNVTDEGYDWVTKIAVPEAMRRARTASPDETAPWQVVWQAMSFGKQMRAFELDNLDKADKNESAITSDPRQVLTDEQKKLRRVRAERRMQLPRDLASLEVAMAPIEQRLHLLRALENARKAVADYPDEKNFKYTLAEIQLELEDWSGARETLQKILQRDPADRRASDMLAQIPASQPATSQAAGAP